MKFQYEEASLVVTTSDDMKEMDFGIKAQDVGFIIQLLRNDMYRYPIDAICREISSNARDANREVCCGDTPIEIIVSKNPYLQSETAISFVDQGAGISPDRMADVFLNYGASTKRETDEQTGGFGLGAKTPFAYTNTFCIETVHDCKKYVYVAMVKSGNKGKMYLLNEEECFEEAGTTVSVPIKQEDVSRFEQAAYRATYFWDVRPIYRNFTTLREVNDYDKVIETDDYLVAMETKKGVGINFARNSRVAVLLDGIPYEIDNSVEFVRELNYLLESLPMDGSALVFSKLKIGEVSISPNRETLQYNDNTVKKLEKCLKEVAQIFEEESEQLFNRTTTLIERAILAHALNSNNAYDFKRVKDLRPFSNYTLAEMVKMYFGIRFMSIVCKRDAAYLKEYNGIKLTQDFSSLFPGLTLLSVSFEKNNKVKCGLRCKVVQSRLHDGFYGLEVYLQDVPKRNSAKERSHYRSHERDMFVIAPSEFYFRYPSLTLEEKTKCRKEYVRAKRSIERLKECGIDHYSLYSDLKNDKVIREKNGVRKQIGFPVRWLSSGGDIISHYLKSIDGDKLEIDGPNKEYTVGDYAYLEVKDLRTVRDFERDKEISLFKVLCVIRGVERKVMFVNKKMVGELKGSIESLQEVLRGITDEEKECIGNLLLVAEHTNSFNQIQKFEFANPEFANALKAWKKAYKKYGSHVSYRGKVSDVHITNGDFEVFRQYASLNDIVVVLKEMEKTFPLLNDLKYANQKNVQEYVTLLEAKVTKEGASNEQAEVD